MELHARLPRFALNAGCGDVMDMKPLIALCRENPVKPDERAL
jgi:hypothetical protein